MRRTAILLIAATLLPSCGNGERPVSWDFREVTETSGATSYIFQGQTTPQIRDADQLAMIDDVNAVLAAISLPPVSNSMRLADPPTFRPHQEPKHQWPDYPGGRLEIQRKICSKSYDRKQDYSCVWKVLHHIEEDGPTEAPEKAPEPTQVEMPRF